MLNQPDTAQYDRITQLLKEQSGQPFGQVDPAMRRSLGIATLGNPMAFLEGLQKAQQSQVQNEAKILEVFEAKKAAGDKQAQALDSRIKMFAGDDPEGVALFLQELNNDPEEIDPSNSYQVMTKLASIAKRTGYRSPESKLTEAKIAALQAKDMPKAQSDAGKIAADFQAGLIDEATYKNALSQANKPQLTATEQKEVFQQEDVISAGADSLAILDQMNNLNSMPTYEGPGAETRAKAGSLYGSTEANNTLELANLGQSLAASMLKTTFTGAISNQERQFLQDLQASAGKTKEQRQRIIDNGKKLIKARVKRSQERMQRIQTGEYKQSAFNPTQANLSAPEIKLLGKDKKTGRNVYLTPDGKHVFKKGE